MAGRNRKTTGVSREQYAATQQAQLEQQARKVPQTYSESFGSKEDLHPARYPNAISHDSVYHDQLFTHIGNLEGRVDSLVRAGSKPVKAMASQIQGHLNRARDEANLSWAAHKAGTEGGAEGIHTATQAYRRAHEHLSNAHKVAVNNLGIKSTELNKLGGANTEFPLLTSTQREGLVEDYTKHVRDSANKVNMSLPAGVAEPTKVSLSDMGPEQEVLRPGAYQQRKLAARPQLSESEIAAKKARKVVSEGLNKLQLSGSKGTLTLGQVEGARRAANEGVAINPYNLPTGTETPHSGVGVTGYNDLLNSAKKHYEFNNPGKKWSESKESKNPVAYATKNRVGIPSQETAIAKVRRLSGLADIRRGDVDSMVGRLVANRDDVEKTQKPVGRGKLISAQYDKESRNSAFKNGGIK